MITALVIVVPVAASVTVSDATQLPAAISSPPADGIIILNPGIYTASGMTVGNAVTLQANTSNGHGPWDTIIDGHSFGTGILWTPPATP